jgi:nucleoside-diphosphate-sugar epimerase
MRVLIIGGNRFLGVELTARLLARGDEVTLLNRGTLVDPFGNRVKRLNADRGTEAFDRALANEAQWDAVVDFALFDGPQTERLVRVLGGKSAHVIAISTGQVYLVRTPRPVIAAESDFDGPVLAASPTPAEEEDWKYGIEKRAVESLLAQSSLPYTVFRLPMVHGARDQKQRLGRLFWKLIDREPILLRRPDAPVRQVFSGAVVDALLASLDRGPSRRAWNLAWSEELTASQFVEHAARVVGTTPRIVSDENATLEHCFLNSKWMSALDASAARNAWGFTHPPLLEWLGRVAHGWISRS